MSLEFIKRQQEQRARAWEEAKALLDTAAGENRDLTADEQEKYDAINRDLDERAAVIERVRTDAEREARAAEMRLPEAPAPVAKRESDADILRSMVRGERRSVTFERRTMSTSADSSVVPTGFYEILQENLQYEGPMLRGDVVTLLNTTSGETIKVPTEASRSVATATAEAAVFTGTQPTFSSFDLKAHKYGALLQVSRELVEDAGIDIVGFIARQFAVAVGTAVNSVLTTGTGTVQPNGIANAAGSALTGGTGVSGAFTAANLITLAHAVDSAYAMRPRAGFMMRRATLGSVRSLQDGSGQFIYSVGGAGLPDTLLGYPVIENPYVPAVGTGAKSVLFGDFSSYHVRQVGGIEVARSEDYGFANDVITFRASVRLDGNLGQSAAVKAFYGAAS